MYRCSIILHFYIFQQGTQAAKTPITVQTLDALPQVDSGSQQACFLLLVRSLCFHSCLSYNHVHPTPTKLKVSKTLKILVLGFQQINIMVCQIQNRFQHFLGPALSPLGIQAHHYLIASKTYAELQIAYENSGNDQFIGIFSSFLKHIKIPQLTPVYHCD